MTLEERYAQWCRHTVSDPETAYLIHDLMYAVREREAALIELVTLKDGKGRTISGDEYDRRKPAAWEAARRAIGRI